MNHDVENKAFGLNWTWNPGKIESFMNFLNEGLWVGHNDSMRWHLRERSWIRAVFFADNKNMEQILVFLA